MIKNQLPGTHLPPRLWCLCLLMPMLGTAFANADLFSLPKSPANPPIEVSLDRLETATSTHGGQAAPDADTCAQNINISVVGESLGGASTSCQLLVKIFFDWAGPDDEIALSGLKLKFAFSGGEGVSIASVPVTFALQCPAYNNGTGCGGCFNFDGLNLNFCFQKGPGPDNLILRRKVNGRPVFLTVLFNTAGNCLSNVSLAAADLMVADTNACTPVLALKKPILPACPQFIEGKIKTAEGLPVPAVAVGARENANQCVSQQTESDIRGAYSLCVCNMGDFELRPVRKDNSLNGVDVLDLALMTKHILGLQLLDSPYRIIAADVNRTSTVSTFDVVTLRKILLGIYDTFPDNTSWRFVPKSYAFSQPNNPFMPLFPEEITTSVSPGQSAIDQDFIGIKVGDVNASVSPRQASGSAWLAANAVSSEKGDYLTVPLRVQNRTPLTALQAAFRFDPEALELMGPSLGDVRGLSPDCFGFTKTAEGLIRLVWLAPDPETDFLRPGQTICHLTFKTKRPLRPGEKALRLEAGDLAPEGYTLDDRRFDLKLAAAQATEARSETSVPVSTGVRAFAAPNPSTGETRLNVESELGGKARVFVFSAFGTRVLYRETALAKGASQIALEGFAALPPGVYAWALLLDATRVAEGRIVKQ